MGFMFCLHAAEIGGYLIMKSLCSGERAAIFCDAAAGTRNNRRLVFLPTGLRTLGAEGALIAAEKI
ncbi:hypothetical protein [Pseudomonas saponiphila]|uniref:hypothetical protein n=1 Tax=Pseudomonas saponiphila TaxID=556534 RepID=UPI000B8512D9|nr:hypothetical protein [Pseudomonas saponiphila]